jgi:hypothetical protein
MRDALTSSGRPSRRRRPSARPQPERLEERSLLSLTASALWGANSAQWNWATGGQRFEVGAVELDAAGNTFIGGSFFGTMNLDATHQLTSSGSRDAFVAKLDPSGQVLWARNVGGVAEDRVFGLGVDGAGNVHATGFITGRVDFGNGVTLDAGNRADPFAWTLGGGSGGTISAVNAVGSAAVGSFGQAIAVTPAGDAVMAGFILSPTTFPGPDPGSTADDITVQPTIGADGKAVSTGFVARLGAGGGFSWAVGYDTGGPNSADAVALVPVGNDPAGGVLTTGRFLRPGTTGDINAFVRRLDGASGATAWTRTFGGGGYDAGTDVVADPATGDALVTGRYVGPIDFSGDGKADVPTDVPVTSSSTFVLRLDAATGNLEWVRDLGARNAELSGTSGYTTNIGRPSIAIDPVGTGRLLAATSFQTVPGFPAVVAPSTTTFGGIAFNSQAESVDTLLVRLNADAGSVVEARRLGGSGTDVPTGLAARIGPGGQPVVALAGNFGNRGAATLNNASFTSGNRWLAGGSLGDAQSLYVARFTEQPVLNRPTTDFDGDGKGDLIVYDPMLSSIWMRPTSLGAVTRRLFGPGAQFTTGSNNRSPNDVPPQAITGDFDGDGLADVAVYEPDFSRFWTLYSDLNQVRTTGPGNLPTPVTLTSAQPFFFGPGSRFSPNARFNPIPLAGDFDGDGRDDLAVYDPTASTLNGSHFFILPSNPVNGAVPIRFGPTATAATTVPPVPLAADVNGDGRDDLIVYQPDTRQFYVRLSGATLGGAALPPTAAFPAQFTFPATAFPTTNRFPATPFAGDFNGDNAAEVGVYDPMGNRVQIRNGSFLFNGAASSNFVLGAGTAATASAPLTLGADDLNGDGKDDLVLYNPMTTRVTPFLNVASGAAASVIMGPANPAANRFPLTAPPAPNVARVSPYYRRPGPPPQVASLAAPPEAIAPPLAPTVTPRRRVLWKG